MTLPKAALFICIAALICTPVSAQSTRSTDAPITTEVEVRADKLAYVPKATEPFTGNYVTLFASDTSKVEHVTPYSKGLKDGKEQLFYKSGLVKDQTEWVAGAAKFRKMYYKDGTLKGEMGTDAAGSPFGSHKRYHPNGKIAIESTMGQNATPDGLEKQYDANGKLLAEYLLDRGKLVKIISETPEAKALREKSAPKP